MKKRRTVGDGALDCAEVINWRKAERQRLIAERLAIPGDIRRRHADHIAASLDEVIGEVRGRVISAYWPFRGEPDLRGFMGRVLSRADDVLSLWSKNAASRSFSGPGVQASRSPKASGVSQCLQAPRKSCPI